MPPDGQGKTIEEIGIHYLVHRNTVGKWLRLYGRVEHKFIQEDGVIKELRIRFAT
jgi:hypothetical protein